MKIYELKIKIGFFETCFCRVRHMNIRELITSKKFLGRENDNLWEIIIASVEKFSSPAHAIPLKNFRCLEPYYRNNKINILISGI